MLCILKAGGLQGGGVNFDAKLEETLQIWRMFSMRILVVLILCKSFTDCR